MIKSFAILFDDDSEWITEYRQLVQRPYLRHNFNGDRFHHSTHRSRSRRTHPGHQSPSDESHRNRTVIPRVPCERCVIAYQPDVAPRYDDVLGRRRLEPDRINADDVAGKSEHALADDTRRVERRAQRHQVATLKRGREQAVPQDVLQRDLTRDGHYG
jgi:hypothetical protein